MRNLCQLQMAVFSFAIIQFGMLGTSFAQSGQGYEGSGQSRSASTSQSASAQSGTQVGNLTQPSAPVHESYAQSQRIRLIAGTSRVIKFGFDVPGVIIGSPDVVDAQPVSSNQIMITGRRVGVSGISVSDPDGNQHTLDILVVGDSRQLQLTMDELFPGSAIRAFPLQTSVVLTGHVEKAAEIALATQIAQDFFPNGVVNKLSVGGPSKIALECKVVEVSRTKLRNMGIDWNLATSGFTIQNSASSLLDGATGAGNFFFRIIDGTDQFPVFLNLLRQNNLAKILTEPKLVTTPGRPATLLNGGLIPIPVNSGLGVQSVEFREFGTKLDVLPMLEGDGRIRVEVRAEVTDVAVDLAVNGTPGFRSRHVDTGVVLKEGQTLALAGLIQNRTDSTTRGIPGLKDMPWVGSLFRRVEDSFNEVELIIIITPRFIEEVDSSLLPEGPGRGTVPPCDTDFFIRGYQEVPRTGHSYELGPINRGTYPHGTIIQPAPRIESMEALPQSDATTYNDQNGRTRSGQTVRALRPIDTNQRVLDQRVPVPRTASRPIRSPYTEPLPKFRLSDQ